jgi:hypothetical protein
LGILDQGQNALRLSGSGRKVFAKKFRELGMPLLIRVQTVSSLD